LQKGNFPLKAEFAARFFDDVNNLLSFYPISQDSDKKMKRILLAKKKIWLLLTLVTTLVALLTLSAGISLLELDPGANLIPENSSEKSSALPSNLDATPSSPNENRVNLLGLLSKILFWGLIPLALLIYLFQPGSKRHIAVLLVLLIAAIYLMATTSQMLAGVLEEQSPKPQFTPIPTTLPGTPVSAPAFQQPTSAWAYAISFLILLLLAGGGYYGYHLWRKMNPPAAPLNQVAQEALDSLDAGAEFKNVVLRCYFQMAKLLKQRQGISRDKAMTPREFEAALTATGLPEQHIHQLTRLFEKVRYSRTAIENEDEKAAIASLQALVATFGEQA
jgi:hypothetical protein